MSIQTVLGRISREELGLVTTHEHALIDLSAFFTSHPVPGVDDPAHTPVSIELLGELNRDPYALKDNLIMMDYALQCREVMRFRQAGGATFVDATTVGIGRNVKKLRQLSIDTGLHVVAGTGFYVGATHSEALQAMNAEEIADILCGELTEGIDGTGIKAGIIGEIGISEEFDESERKVLHAAAIAHSRTGAPIEVHINPWTVHGIEAAELLLNDGVEPNRICICHIDVINCEPYIRQLLNMGVYIEFDNFGKEYYVDARVRNSGYGCFVRDSERVALIKRLLEAGYGDQLLLSCDVCLKTLLRAYGGWGYDHVLVNIVPMMQEVGVDVEAIARLLQHNPADFLDNPSIQ